MSVRDRASSRYRVGDYLQALVLSVLAEVSSSSLGLV